VFTISPFSSGQACVFPREHSSVCSAKPTSVQDSPSLPSFLGTILIPIILLDSLSMGKREPRTEIDAPSASDWPKRVT